jgi:predicted DCC family thiol-disulfide oxidoreductase YuxK
VKIFYDRECGFCRRMLRIVLRRDQRRERLLTPVALQDPSAARELPELDETQRMASWHLKTPAGEIYSAGAAFAPLVELLGLPAWFASFLRRHDALTERGYRWVAEHRVMFGRLTRRLPDLEDSSPPCRQITPDT